MSKKNLVIIIAVVILVISVTVIISVKNTKNADVVNVTAINSVEKEQDLLITKKFGDTVSKLMNMQQEEYEFLENYLSYYDSNGNVIFDYDKGKMNFESYIIFETYRNSESKQIKIIAKRFYKTGDEKLYSELYFNSDEIYFLINDEARGDDTSYGYGEKGEFFIFDAKNVALEKYENNILAEQLEIKNTLLNENNKSFDDFSKSPLKNEYSANIIDFVPKDYEMVGNLTVEGDINKDEYTDIILVMQKKINYEKSDGFYAYPRIAMVLVKDENDRYKKDGYLSNLIAPLSAKSSVEDSFRGFRITNGVIIVENHFFDTSKYFYVQKYRENDYNRLQLIGYTKGFDYQLSETSNQDKIFITEDYNLLTGKLNLNIDKTNILTNEKKSESTSVMLGKKSIFYNEMQYNSDLEPIKSFESIYLEKAKK